MSRFPEAATAAALLLLAASSTASAQDAVAGEKLFSRCKACHAVGDGAKNRVGPQLNGVVGRIAGTAEAYKYSAAMAKAGADGLVWDSATLNEFLTNPRGMIKGTKMAFSGFKKDDDRANMIAYLATFSPDAPADKAEETPPASEPADAGKPSELEPEDAAETPKTDAGDGHGAGLVLGLGRPATDDEIAAWDIDVRPDGLGLPKGSGTVAHGEELYDANCAACHGDFGEAIGRWPVLAGGRDTLTNDRPVKTVGSYWPYLSTVYDYIRRAMPFGNARSLSDDDVYALTAYVLYLNDIVTDENFELSDKNFTSIHLPNENSFIDDNRAQEPEYANKGHPCMSDCVAGKAKITMHAAVLDVTPEAADDDKTPAAGIE